MAALMTAVQTEQTITEVTVNNPDKFDDDDIDENSNLTTTLNVDETNAFMAESTDKMIEPTDHRIPVIKASNEEHANEKKSTTEKKPYGGRPLRFQCPNCDRRFHAPSHLKRHMLCHSSERPFQCHICGKGFLQAWHLGRHMTTHTGNKPFKCPECPKTFGSRFEMKTHSNYIHKGIKEHQCNVCKKMFTLRSNLKVHMRKHSGEKPYVCDICGKRFGQRGHLQYHLRKHANEQNVKTEKALEPPAKKIEEKKVENTQTRISYDSGVDSNSSDKSRLSPIFMFNSTTQKTMESRASLVRSPENVTNLPLSGRIFDHTNPKELKPYVCDSCNCGFAEINSLRSHVRHSHPKRGITNALFSCAYCNTFFYDIEELRQHFYYNHLLKSEEQNVKLNNLPKDESERRIGQKHRSMPDITEISFKMPFNERASPYSRSQSVKSAVSDPGYELYKNFPHSPQNLSPFPLTKSPKTRIFTFPNEFVKSPNAPIMNNPSPTRLLDLYSPDKLGEQPLLNKSPSTFSSLSDTTYDRSPVLESKFSTCPVGCKCRLSAYYNPVTDLSKIIEERYMYHMEQYEKFLQSHVSLMEALQYSRRR